ncbi:MAG: glycoside hydrolase family 9 protein [Bacteroidales bacterium]|nr:glycoside hydrolase family 9 protein [Bacteroidales bacterium]
MQKAKESRKSVHSGTPGLFELKCTWSKRILIFIFPIVGLLSAAYNTYGQKLQINDLEYFETPGVNILVFSNQFNGFFFDEKTAGIEIIHHGVRTATGGAVRLKNTPEQWDLIPTVVDRKADKVTNAIDVVLRYEEYDFNSRVNVTPKDDGVLITVYLDKPLPEKLEGHAGFNMEFLPASYFEKTYLADGKPGSFSLYPASNTVMRPVAEKIPQFANHNTFDDRGRDEFIDPKPIAAGNTIVLAPEDPERYVKIQSETEIMLFDGRNLAQNGWFVVRSMIPAQKTGNVLQWYVKPNAMPNWKRSPVIAFNQVGYHPAQEKVAVIELDKNDVPLTKASLYQVTADGEPAEKLTADLKPWGKFLRYNYIKFDFTSVKEPGLYFIQYGDQKTNPFAIDASVYDNIWHPTMDVWFPVQMDHMQVNEAYRIWHGRPYLDDALQAPVNHQHFDGYKMGPVTDTKYKPLERIPGLDVGGWFDAGDFDIQTGSHNEVILSFVDAWERFGISRDETYIDQATRYVDIHRPDGKPDVLQQLEHGTLNVVAQCKNIGHPARGIIVPNLHQYHHLGDASTETDNLPYNPNLKPYETDGKSSGTMDDRWAFTNRTPVLDYQTIASLAAANRALQNYNKPLADDCLMQAKRLWEEEKSLTLKDDTIWVNFVANTEMMAALQLYIATKDDQYAKRFKEMVWPALDKALERNITVAIQAYTYMDEPYKKKLKDYVIQYKELNNKLSNENPYGVPISTRGWAGNTQVINWAITNYYACKLFPEIIGPEYVYKGLHYILGCHPYSNLSFVTTVGTKSKKVTYGNNRADFRFIAGGIVPGVLLLKPDFLENKDDWPFLWGENECVIDTGAAWVLLSGAVNDLVNK